MANVIDGIKQKLFRQPGGIPVEELYFNLMQKYPLGEVIRDANLLREAKRAIEQKHPGAFNHDLLTDPDLVATLDELEIADMMQSRGISIGALLDDEYRSRVTDYYSKLYPQVDLRISMAHELLEGKWATETEDLLDEVGKSDLENSHCGQIKPLKNSSAS